MTDDKMIEAIAKTMLRDELDSIAPRRDFDLAWESEKEVWLMNAKSALRAVREGQWQPIDSAPRDGTKIDVINHHGERTTDVYFSPHRNRWVHWWQQYHGSMGEVELDIAPTHWMPLPTPPKE